jgi:hypothetical protein
VFAEAFNFQEMDFSEALILENMREHRCAPNSRTYENILTLHCRHQRIDKAGLAIKNPPKKNQKTILKKPTINVFLGFFNFFFR